ncbi:MAG TPA: patatin-like phospholipase family protein [Acidobacteriota bacterium]|nr:patatin-like phospholipase family protein [Acidobacteriota bacterium]
MNKKTVVRWLWIGLLALGWSWEASLALERGTQGQGQQRPKVALVLSGGGARGGAHVGVIAALEEAGVPIDFISGASFGAVVGGLYSVGYSPHDLQCILSDVDWTYLFDEDPDRRLLSYPNKQRSDRGLFELHLKEDGITLPTGIQSGQRIQQLLERLTAVPLYQAGNDYDRLRIPFRAVATDLLKGRVRTFRQGPLSTALRASMAVPGIFMPVRHEGTLLVDGGVLDNLPVEAALEWGADIIIAVDVSTPLRQDPSEFSSFLDVLDQTVSLHIEADMAASRAKADVVIQPDLAGFTSASFDGVGAMFPAGRQAVRDKLEAIRQLLEEKGIDLPASNPTPSVLGQDHFNGRTHVYAPAAVDIGQTEVRGADRLLREEVAENVERPQGPVGASDIRRFDHSVSRIYGSLLFDSAAFHLQPPPGPHTSNQAQPPSQDSQSPGSPPPGGSSGPPGTLLYEVEPAPRSNLGLGLRYDREYQFTGAFDFTSRRFKGSDFDLFASALVGNVRRFDAGLQGGSASSREFFFSTSFNFLTYDRLIFEGDDTVAEFQDQRLGWSLSLNRLIADSGRARLEYRIEQALISRGLGVFSQPGSETLSGLTASFDWDSFDRNQMATKGLRARIALELQDRALGSDFSYLSARASLHQRWTWGPSTIGAGGWWRLIDGGAPFYELVYAGGEGYFDFSGIPFAGLRREESVSKQAVVLQGLYRRLLHRFRFGVLRSISAQGIYNAGFFSSISGRDLGGPRHGAAFGASFDVQYLGPVQVMLGRAEDSDWTTYFSIGHRF